MKLENIYLIDDDNFFALTFIKRLKKIEDYNIRHFASCELAFESIKTDAPQIIFLDHLLGGENGVDALPKFKELLPNTDIVIVSGQQDVEVMKRALESGAAKYFSKDSLLMENTKDFVAEVVERPSVNSNFWNNFFKSYSSAFTSLK